MFGQKRSLKLFKEFDEEYQKIKDTLNKYENNKIALRKNKLSSLYKELWQLKEERKNSCPHEKVVVEKGTYVDQGYGCDRYYDTYSLYCNHCGNYLLNSSGQNYRSLTEEQSLIDSVKSYEKYTSLSDDEFRKLGVSKTVQTKHEYNYRRY